MSKNIRLNNTDYSGVSTVQLPTTSGGTATFKDTDEITTPSGVKNITENGTHDVTNFASAVVNVPTETTGGGASFELKGTYTVNTTGYVYNESTIDNAVLTPSYENGMIVLVVDSADSDWSDNANGLSRLFLIYTSDKYTVVSQGYRSGNGEQCAGNNQPIVRETTGAGNFIKPSFGNTYTNYLNSGQSVKKYEMELDSTIAQALLYYSA